MDEAGGEAQAHRGGAVEPRGRAPSGQGRRAPRGYRALYEQARAALDRERAAREAAEARANQLDVLFEAMADGVVLYARDGGILRMNTSTREIYGLDADAAYATRPLRERMPDLLPRDEHGDPMPVDDWPQTRLLRGETLRGDSAADVRVRTRDGRDRQINISGAPIYDARGEMDGVVAVFRDVTERRRLERRTAEALAALLAMAETLVFAPTTAPPPAGLDGDSRGADGSMRDVAARLAELARSVLGCRRVGILTVEPADRTLHPTAEAGFSPEDAARWAVDWSTGRRLGDRLAPALVERLRAGEAITLDVTQPAHREQFAPFGITSLVVAPMRVGERLVGLFGVDYGPALESMKTPAASRAKTSGERPKIAQGREEDQGREETRAALTAAIATLAALVVERHHMLHERAEARARELALREANRQMDEFLSIASHELKTPLTSIKAYLQVVAKRLRAPAPPAASAAEAVEKLQARLDGTIEVIERVQGQTDALIRLVADLLDASRIQVKKLALRVAPCDLVGIVRAVVEAQRVANPARAIALRLPSRPLMVLADADRIGQVMTNYLTNALKYSPPDTPVAVALAVTRGQARVTVADQGPGLPPEEQEAIWERFHRAPGVRDHTGSGAGLGLGLYISRSLVERQGGHVGLESAPGAGSTFSFTLPLAHP